MAPYSLVCFSQVSIFAGTKSDCTKISTSGVDGNIIIWDLKVCDQFLSSHSGTSKLKNFINESIIENVVFYVVLCCMAMGKHSFIWICKLQYPILWVMTSDCEWWPQTTTDRSCRISVLNSFYLQLFWMSNKRKSKQLDRYSCDKTASRTSVPCAMCHVP